jgi:hypothetical protein
MRNPSIDRNRRGEKFKILFHSLLSGTVNLSAVQVGHFGVLTNITFAHFKLTIRSVYCRPGVTDGLASWLTCALFGESLSFRPGLEGHPALPLQRGCLQPLSGPC